MDSTIYLLQDTTSVIDIVTQWETDWLGYLHPSYWANKIHFNPVLIHISLSTYFNTQQSLILGGTPGIFHPPCPSTSTHQ